MSVAVSVVVPVFNSSRYLNQCVDSLVNQTLKDVEFIFVDDGSTDNSVEILKQYQAKDARIKLLQQENQYAGVARNNGMKQAAGKYIIFLDSDDFFKCTMLEEAYRCAEKNQAEIVVFGHYDYDDQTRAVTAVPFHVRYGVFSAEMLGEEVFSAFYDIPWNKLFLKEYLVENDLAFQPIYKHNDVYFVKLSVALAERIVCLNKHLAYYRVNNSDSLQGKGMFAYPFLIECYTALKQSLIAHGKFHGCMRTAFKKRAGEAIELRARQKTAEMVSEQFFENMKKNLIPNLFDTPEDFADEPILKSIYDSEDYNNYILLLVENQKEETVSKKSKDYILGHTLLEIPRRIKRALLTKKL